MAAAALGVGVLLSLMGRSIVRDNSLVGNAKCPPPGQAVTIGAGWKAEGGETAAAALPGKGEGFLVVNSFPVSEVLLDRRSIGWAPFRVGEKVKLAAGPHQLTLRNHNFAPLSATIEIAEGKTHEVQCWFDDGQIRVLERR